MAAVLLDHFNHFVLVMTALWLNDLNNFNLVMVATLWFNHFDNFGNWYCSVCSAAHTAVVVMVVLLLRIHGHIYIAWSLVVETYTRVTWIPWGVGIARAFSNTKSMSVRRTVAIPRLILE